MTYDEPVMNSSMVHPPREYASGEKTIGGEMDGMEGTNSALGRAIHPWVRLEKLLSSCLCLTPG